MRNVKRILVPTDFSLFGEEALSLACSLPDSEEAEIHLLHVLHENRLLLDNPVAIRDRRHQALEELYKCLPPETEMTRSVHHEVREGLPHVEICNYAREHEIELIVIGTRGRTGLSHIILGSVAERVLRQAPCTVLVVRPHVAEPTESDSRKMAETQNHQDAEVKLEMAPAIDLIQRAVSVRATDIHVDPTPHRSSLVRFRIDGRLEPYCELDEEIADRLIHQLKNLANLDIADPFHPQEGRLRLPSICENQEARLTTAPVAGGQAAALRLFDRNNIFRPFDELGFSEHSRTTVERMLQRGEGLVLVTGPTGSGKSTTVYSMLQVLSTTEKNIVSIEDPVEFEASFIRQMAVDLHHGISMSSGLRTMLRMDPDIMFLGEIRDPEAADITMRAASSGKYVFTTFHTRDIAATVTTLRDYLIDNRSIAGNLTGIINQRLVRKLCPSCLKMGPVPDEVRDRFHAVEIEPPQELATPVGCQECRETGYYGRIGIFETFVADAAFSEAIQRGASEDEIRQVIRAAGTYSLEYDGLQKVIRGVTSYQELQEVCWL